MSVFLLGIVKERAASAYFLAHDKDITPEQARYLSNVSMQVLLTGGQVLVHKVTADGFKTGRKKNPKKQDSQKKDPKSKKEPAEAKDVPNRKKERAEAKAVASKDGGRVVEQGKVRSTAVQQTYKDMGSLRRVGTLKADEILKYNGFVFKGRTPLGYYKYYHPNGAKVQIRPCGQVYRYGGGKGLKYNSDGSLSVAHGQENILK